MRVSAGIGRKSPFPHRRLYFIPGRSSTNAIYERPRSQVRTSTDASQAVSAPNTTRIRQATTANRELTSTTEFTVILPVLTRSLNGSPVDNCVPFRIAAIITTADARSAGRP